MNFLKPVTTLFFLLLFSTAIASAWEGNATVVPSGDLPGGNSIATNAFPRNSIVYVTNLENDRILRVIVVSGLDTSGLLATVSRSAARALDIRDNSVHRVLLQQPTNLFEFNRLQEMAASSSIPSASPASALAGPAHSAEEHDWDEWEEDDWDEDNWDDEWEDAFLTELPADPEPIADAGIYETPFEAFAGTSAGSLPDLFYELPSAPSAEPSHSASPPAHAHGTTVITLVPSEERVPGSSEHVIPPDYFIPPIDSRVASTSTHSPLPETMYELPPAPLDFSPFLAPLVSQLERGMWYVQIAAYTQAEHVENEISRMGMVYPMVIQNIGTDINPMFRVLLGPLNQGEGGAMLQRVKSIGYSDAFMRQSQ